MNSQQAAENISRRVLVTDPEAVFDMQQRQAEAMANMVGTESSRIDALFRDMGSVRGTVEVVHGKVDAVAAGVSKLTDAMAVLVTHEVKMEHNAAEVRELRATQAEQNRALRATQEDQERRLQAVERKVPGYDELRVWVIRAGLGVLGLVGAALVALVLVK